MWQMNTTPTLRKKLLLTGILFLLSVLGLLIKLPVPFRHIDRELHFAFYFVAAGYMNIVFAHGRLTLHALIFAVLYAFGVAIEYAQAYSNRFFSIRIHGNYDPVDVSYNLQGLIAFSAVWVVGRIFYVFYKKRTQTR